MLTNNHDLVIHVQGKLIISRFQTMFLIFSWVIFQHLPAAYDDQCWDHQISMFSQESIEMCLDAYFSSPQVTRFLHEFDIV